MSWRQRQLVDMESVPFWLNLQPLHAGVVISRHPPDTSGPVGDVQHPVSETNYNVAWVIHSFDVNTFTEWAECVGGVRLNDGGPRTDNIHDVTQLGHSIAPTYNVRTTCIVNDLSRIHAVLQPSKPLWCESLSLSAAVTKSCFHKRLYAQKLRLKTAYTLLTISAIPELKRKPFTAQRLVSDLHP